MQSVARRNWIFYVFINTLQSLLHICINGNSFYLKAVIVNVLRVDCRLLGLIQSESFLITIIERFCAYQK